MRYLFAIQDVAPIAPQGDTMAEDWKFKLGDRVVLNTSIPDEDYADIEAGTPGEIVETRPGRTFPYLVRFDNGLEQLCYGNELYAEAPKESVDVA